jgi:hypothetical protein
LLINKFKKKKKIIEKLNLFLLEKYKLLFNFEINFRDKLFQLYFFFYTIKNNIQKYKKIT